MQQQHEADEAGGAQGRWEGIRRSIGGYVYGSGTNSPEGRGGRRQKLAEYVRAANELRQSYYNQNSSSTSLPRAGRWNTYYEEGAQEQPSSEELMEYVTNGKEEIVLFPSYGRKRLILHNSGQKLQPAHDIPNAIDEEFLEDDNIVADVDIRGWIYTPHTASPPTRKNRLVMAMMAKLCGLPSLPVSPNSSSPGSQENNLGQYTEQEAAQALGMPLSSSAEAMGSAYSAFGSAASRLPWIGSRLGQQPPGVPQTPLPILSRSEIEQLHTAMQTRLSPFLTTPAFHMPLTVFLYNNTNAQSTTLRTDNLGHFAIRKPLPFLPTHVRVLAGELLCAEDEIRYIDPDAGISLISDIDDTIKISGIGTGLREMFKNVFTREMSTMPVPGVAEWFNDLAAAPLNVQVHYLSNSPWQLFPFLKELLIDYMKLPNGTWHLKKYSGFVQGIFEPVIERKKESLEGLMRDFPGRRWILVGDGGEGDLEVYTEVVKKWPGKVIAVYIRDVSGIGEKVVGTGFVPKDSLSSNVDGNSTSQSYMTQDNTSRSFSIKESKESLLGPPSALRLTPDAPSNSSTTESAQKKPPPIPPKPRQLRSHMPPDRDVEENLIDLEDTESLDPIMALYDGREYGAPSPPRPRPPPPPRRGTTSSLNNSRGYRDPFDPDPITSKPALSSEHTQMPRAIDKKAEMWKKRWEYADQVLEEQGVLLRSWRVGNDVHEECVALAKAYLGL